MTFSAEDILMMSKPGELFSDDPDIMRKEYKELAKAWHPDLNDAVSEANEVMTKINLLYLQCVNSIKTGRWEKPGFIKLFDKAGKAYEIRYLNSESFELGTMYIANSIVF
ncbi:MAG: J domain-containing protein, partial [Bacillota bacterium]|nr:J domain-containing protein [Bacillota bacterium]